MIDRKSIQRDIGNIRILRIPLLTKFFYNVYQVKPFKQLLMTANESKYLKFKEQIK